MSDKALFVCGIVLSAASAAGLAASLIVCRIRGLKLDRAFDEEYGRKEKGR